MTTRKDRNDQELEEYVQSDLDNAAVIHLGKIRENISLLREKIGPKTRLLFAVKTDAYGHGLVPVAKEAVKSEVDYLGVSSIQEGIRLRDHEFQIPILAFNPPHGNQIEKAVHQNLTVTVTSLRHYREIENHLRNKDSSLQCQIIVDTGMSRLGVKPRCAVELARNVDRGKTTTLTGIYSHLSSAGSKLQEDKKFTGSQIESFRTVLKKLNSAELLPPLRHISNSAGFLQFGQAVTADPLNMVRCGTVIYGYPEFPTSWSQAVKPALGLFSRIIDTRLIPSGQFVSYGRTHQCKRPTSAAVFPLGYGHGLDRRLSNSGKVRVGGRKAPIIGKICCDKTIVDVTGIEPGIGEPVEVMGRDPTALEQARSIGADVVELTTGLTVPRLYIEPG